MTFRSAPLDSLAAGTFRRDVKIIGLIGSAHCLSHFFQLVLPPLFPLLKADFGVTYTTLGALVSVFYVASGLCQFGAGFAVDRFGARPVLLGGIGLLAGGALVAGLMPDVFWLFPLAFVMGMGNGVFHPADFAVLNANVAPRRLGHAYSTHGIGGSLGYAMAPVVSYGLGSMIGWRHALVVLGAVGLVALAALATQGGALMLLVGAVPAVASLAIALFAVTGFALGATGPSRDMIVRGATPPGASGRVYGFVYSGLDLGSTIAPVAVGTLLDRGEPRAVFVAVAVCLFLAIGTVLQVRRSAVARTVASAAD